jgi:predicted nucleotide-binding protein (sugar kinase/HSP70/actin superfamily)
MNGIIFILRNKAALRAIRSEAPRLHGLRLAYAANSAREKSGLKLKKTKKDIISNFDIMPFLKNS